MYVINQRIPYLQLFVSFFHHISPGGQDKVHVINIHIKWVMFLCYISAPAAAPGNLTVVNISANELNVSWERPNEIDINGVLRYYILEYYIVNQTETLASTNVSGDTLSTVLRGLNNFTSYNVSVAAFTIGTGPSSTEVETTSENGGFAKVCSQLSSKFIIICRYCFVLSSRRAS